MLSYLNSIFRRGATDMGSQSEETNNNDTETADFDAPESSNRITVHPFTDDPNEAWADLVSSHGLRCDTVPLPLVDSSEPKPEGTIRVVCLSDTHSRLHRCLDRIPDGDILIHAGDFTFTGALNEIEQFNEALGTLPHPHKLVVAGNHELSFDRATSSKSKHNEDGSPERLLTSCTYLFDSHVTLYGYKFYGAPWQPRHLNWAFNVNRGNALLRMWKRIPDDTDVLITHGPPLGHGDMLHRGDRLVAIPDS